MVLDKEGTSFRGRTGAIQHGASPRLDALLGFILLFQPPLEDDVLLEGPAFPISCTFVQELFQAQYRYDIL